MEVRNLTWLLEFKDSASESINKVNKSFDSTADKLKNMSETMSKTGKDLTKKITAPVVALGTKALHSVSNFDDGMSRVRSLTGATGEDFDKLREKAIQLGNDTAYSAQDASEMMQVLAASGMETNDILETSGDIFSLMSAGSTDAETAASVLTNTMAQFNMTAEESTRIVDGFAKGSAAAKLGVEDLEYILGQAGGSLASMNMDMEQSIAAAGHLANAGMPIGQVGSALNAMSREVKANADEFKELGINVYDNEGKLKDLGTVMGELESKVGGMTDAQRDNALSSVFSGQAMKAATDWIGRGSDAYKDLTKEIYDASGASEDMARVNEDNIGGALRSLSSSLGTLMINIGDVIKGPVQDLADWIKEIADRFNNAAPATKRMIVAIGGVAAAIGPVMTVGSKLLEGLSGVMKKMSLTRALLVVFVGALVYLWKTNKEFRNKVVRTWENIQKIVSNVVEELQALWEKHGDSLINTFKRVWDTIVGIVDNVVGVAGDIIGAIYFAMEGDWANMEEHLYSLSGTLMNILSTVLNAVWEVIKGVISSIAKAFLELIKWVVGGLFDFIGGLVSSLVEGVYNIISNIVQGIVEFVRGVLELIGSIFEGIYMKFQGIFDGILLIIEGFIEMLKIILLGPVLLILDLVTLDFEAFKEDAIMLWEGLTSSVSTMLEGFGQVIAGVWEYIRSSAAAAWEGVKGVISSVIDWLFTLPGRALDAMTQLMESMVEGISNGVSNVKSAIEEVGESIITSLKEIPGKVVDIGKNIMTNLAKGIKSGIMAPVNAAKEAGSRIRGFLGGGGGKKAHGRHRTGLSRVPFDGYRAILHKDEEVLTADDPRNINNAGRQAVRNIGKQPSQPTQFANTNSGTVFSPSININIEGNTDVNTVRQIEEAVNAQMNLFFRKLNLQRA